MEEGTGCNDLRCKCGPHLQSFEQGTPSPGLHHPKRPFYNAKALGMVVIEAPLYWAIHWPLVQCHEADLCVHFKSVCGEQGTALMILKLHATHLVFFPMF